MRKVNFCTLHCRRYQTVAIQAPITRYTSDITCRGAFNPIYISICATPTTPPLDLLFRPRGTSLVQQYCKGHLPCMRLTLPPSILGVLELPLFAEVPNINLHYFPFLSFANLCKKIPTTTTKLSLVPPGPFGHPLPLFPTCSRGRSHSLPSQTLYHASSSHSTIGFTIQTTEGKLHSRWFL